MTDHDLRTLAGILSVIEELSAQSDLDAVLDRLLYEARRFAQAEAGSVFLVGQGRLVFSYVHNDRLFLTNQDRKHLYAGLELPMDHRSIAGHAARTATPVVVEDAYALDDQTPYSFNFSFDLAAGYQTRSVLAVPLKTSQKKVVGVLQVINALDQGRIRPFTEADRVAVSYFANHAAAAVERAMLARQAVQRLAQVAELRDPHETGPHVNRVGAYAAEIFQRWAAKKGWPEREIRHTQGLLRQAAMLHDVGKVAVSDLILKKPGRLTPEEYETMKLHTLHGARLLHQPAGELEAMSHEIALNHHEAWDGSGYPGRVDDLDIPETGPRPAPGKKGEEIPISARITALADVYDALVSRRCYKEPWPEDQALAHIRQDSGKKFDPEVVESFLSIHEVIRAIHRRFPEA